MEVLDTKSLGRITYEPGSAIEFPKGLPGFDWLRRFVAVHTPGSNPLIFLQSLEDPGVCFITAPVGVIDSRYRIDVDSEALEEIGLPTGRQVLIGQDALCLTVLSVREEGVSANLMAPVLVNLANRKAIQAVTTVPGYSHREELMPEAIAC